MSDFHIREYRKNRNMTIKELSLKTGLSIGYISQIERGETEPSLSSIRKIANVFGVPLYVLISEENTNPNLTIRKEDRVNVHTKKSSVSFEFLTPLPSHNFSPKTIMIKAIVQPHSQDSEIPIVHHSEEVLLVLKGTLTVMIGDTVIELHEGDTTMIGEDLPHICINNTAEPLEVLSTITPPVWGTLHFPE